MKKYYYSELSNEYMFSIFYSHSEKRKNVFRKHFHTETELGFMLRGEGTYMLGEKLISAAPGKLFIIRSDEQHCVPTILSEELISLNMYLSPYFLWNVCADYIPPHKIQALISSDIPINNCTRNSKIASCYEKIIPLFESESSEARFKLRSEVLNLISIIAEEIETDIKAELPPATRFNDIQRAAEFIKNNYSHSISLDDIAKSAAMSRSYLSNTFKAVIGMSPYNYLLRIRIDKAMKLLRDSDMTVIDISSACGFTSLTSFNKAFKALAGFTPTELRQNKNPSQ